MTIWTDSVHLVSDKDDEELHGFARSIGFRRSWFQDHRFPRHYDITTSAAARRAVTAGARCVARMTDLLRILPDSRHFQDGFCPPLLDAEAAAMRTTRLLRMFAPGRKIGRRGVEHLTTAGEMQGPLSHDDGTILAVDPAGPCRIMRT